MSYSQYLLFVVYIKTSHMTKSSSILVQEFDDMSKIYQKKKLIEDLNVFRKYVRVRKYVSDEI